LVSCSTHWDARLVAFAATAARQVAAANLPLEAVPVFYALYRVGMPTDQQSLAMVPSPVVKLALERAADAGIVTMNPDQIVGASRMFEIFAKEARLALRAAGVPSTFGESFPPNVPQAEQAAFTKAYFDHPTTGANLWDAAAAAGVSASTIEALK